MPKESILYTSALYFFVGLKNKDDNVLPRDRLQLEVGNFESISVNCIEILRGVFGENVAFNSALSMCGLINRTSTQHVVDKLFLPGELIE